MTVPPAGIPSHGLRRGFTIAEAVMAMIVLALLTGAVLSTIGAAAKSRQIASDRLTGRLVADDLMAEILEKEYAEPGNLAALLGPDASEVNGASRVAFDDVDDFNALVETPPRKPDGTTLPGMSGTGPRAWSRRVSVTPVASSNPTQAEATETTVKRITVTVWRGNQTVATAVAVRTGAWSRGETVGKVRLQTRNVATVDAN